jgi:hypothetical protein
MTFNSAKDLIRDVSKDNWQTNQKADGTFVTWLPILKLTFDLAPQRLIGLSDNGFWTAQFNTGDIQLIDTREGCYHLLVCLQKDRDHFENLLKDNLIKNALDDAKLADTFPLTELLKMTLQTDTHWAENAAFWLQEKDIDEELETILSTFIDNKRHSQKARHHAFAILKRWQKNR